MSDKKSERLGLRGVLNLIESTLKLIGGANATGAITAGAALHTLGQKEEMLGSIQFAAVVFLLGLTFFAVAYMFWVMTSIEMDNVVRADDAGIGYDEVLLPKKQTIQRGTSSTRAEIFYLVDDPLYDVVLRISDWTGERINAGTQDGCRDVACVSSSHFFRSIFFRNRGELC